MNVIGVDVGTTSVRLAIISFQGENASEAAILACHQKDIGHYQDGQKFEQSSREIWLAICECCRECIKMAGLQGHTIKGIAFSATCSLVIQAAKEDNTNAPRDVIMWMDHRAIVEAQRITSSRSKCLNQFGGVCSPEFSLAKLIWLQTNEPGRFESAAGFFELPDWLVYKCIGGEPGACPRSLCCVVCKWGYDVEGKCHCDLIRSLETDPKVRGRLNGPVLEPGTVAGYMSLESAAELGIVDAQSCLLGKENMKPFKVVVGTSLIDAHSGMLAMLSVPLRDYNVDQKIESTFCSLAGTSSCHMLLSKEPKFTHGIWGPYKNVIIDGYHLLEAGQSMTGKLIEISIESHEEGKMRLNAGERMYDIIGSLNERLMIGSNRAMESELHMLPTFHGNRSPLANPRLRGGIYGLSSEGSKSLLEHYMATVESFVYETKLIVETLGAKLDTMLVSGGLMKNSYYMQTLADVLGCRVIRMSLEGVDFMVMGSGLVACHAVRSSMLDISTKTSETPAKINNNRITRGGPLSRFSIEGKKFRQLMIKIYQPSSERFSYHEKKYLCYKQFVELSQRIDKIMNPLV